MKLPLHLTAALLASLCAGGTAPSWAADGNAIYRCGPDGRQYSQTPCAGGRAVDVSDPRTPAQRAEALDNVKRERLAGRDLEHDRVAAESRARRGGGATGIVRAPQPEATPVPAPARTAERRRPRASQPEFIVPRPAPESGVTPGRRTTPRG